MRLHAKIVSILREALTKLPNRSVGGDFKIDTLNDPDIENDHYVILELVDGDRFHQLEFKNPYYVNAFEDGRYVLDDWAKLSCLGNNPVGGVFVAKDNTVIGYCDISFFSCRRSLGSWRVKHLRRDSFKDKEPWEICWAPIRVEQKWLSSEQAKVVIATRIDMLCRDGYESSKNFRDLFEVIHGVKIRPWGSRHE